MPDLQSTLLKVALPVFVIGVIVLAARRRGLDLRDAFAWRRPSVASFAAWLAVWIAWMAATEALGATFGIAQPRPWPPMAPLLVGLRIAAIGVLGPLAEELLFRGLLYFRLSRTKLGELGSVVVIAAIWAAIHFQYDLPTVAFVFADGIVLGLARRQSHSIATPAAMHVLGNLFSIYQSLRA